MDPRKQIEGIGKNSMLSGWRMIVLLFAILFALAGFGLRYIEKANDQNAWRLNHEGVTSLATITNKSVDTSHTTNRNESGMKHYVLEYSFPLLGSDKQWNGSDEVSEFEYNTVKIGDQFDVRYLSKDPDIATILEDAYAAGAKLAKTISTALFILATLLILVLLFGRGRTRQG